jgi:hypothetical protein
MSRPKPPRPTTPPPPPRPRPPTPGRSYLPTLGMKIRDVERTLRQAINTLGRPHDPASEPQDMPPMTPSFTDRHLGQVVAEIRYALDLLGDLADLGLPAAGSAVPVFGPPLAANEGVGGGPSPTTGRRSGEEAAARPVQDATAPGVPLGKASDVRHDSEAGPKPPFTLPATPHSWARPVGDYVLPGTYEVADAAIRYERANGKATA